MAGAVIMECADRVLGKTESNWCAAVEGGTGITITSILFSRRVPLEDLELSLSHLLALHPRLRSVIDHEDNEFRFHTPADASAPRIEQIEWSEGVETLRLITEEELNAPFSTEYPLAVFVPKLYLLPKEQCVLVLRVHAAAADMASTATIVKDIVTSLHKRPREVHGEVVSLPSVEDAIPPGQANKPFWAHGVDVVGYGLVSRRHAYLPFEDTESGRMSKLLRGGLSAEATSLLLKVNTAKSLAIKFHNRTST